MKKLMTTGGILAAMLGPSLASGGELPAQEAMQGLQFNLSPPGARSLGMAGAFIGRADDATAAYANPAGLVNLFAPEISLEGRMNDFDTSYTSGGTYPDDLTRSSTSSDTSGLSFGSFAIPVSENFVLAAYAHQYTDFESSFDANVITVPVTIQSGTPVELLLNPSKNNTSLDIKNYGFSLGWRLAEAFSIGLGVSYYDYSMLATTDRFVSEEYAPGAPPGFVVGDTLSTGVTAGSDNDVGFNLGLLWRMSEAFTLGFVYRSAPKFDTSYAFTDFSDSGDAFGGSWVRDFAFETPDMYGVGLSWQPTDRWTIGLDVNRVNYSNVAATSFSPFVENPSALEQESLDNVGIDDVTEVRLGVEYVFADMNNPLALRAGIWNDPDHELTSNNSVNLDSVPIEDLGDTASAALYDSLFLGGDDELHYTFGLGMTFERFQLDAAADFSDVQNIYSVSGVFFFR